MPRTAIPPLTVLSLSILLSGCGSDPIVDPPPPPPPPPVTTVVLQKTFTGLPPFLENGQAWLDGFQVSSSGTLDITVDWTFDTNDIDFSIFQGTLAEVMADCSNGPCSREVAIARSVSKPETLHYANATAGPYLLQIVNFGTVTESGTYEVRLTTVSSASGSVAAASRSWSGLGATLGEAARR